LTNDNKYIISGSSDKSLKVFDLHLKKLVYQIPNAHKGIRHFGFLVTLLGNIRAVLATPDSKFIIAGADDNSIKIFDLQTKKEVFCFDSIHKGTFLLSLILNS